MDGYKSLEIDSKRQQIHFLPGTRKNSKLLYCFFSDLRKIKMPVTITTPTQRGKKKFFVSFTYDANKAETVFF